MPSEATSLPISEENALATGVSSAARSSAARRAAALGALRARSIATAGRIADRARGVGQRAHAEQHALYVGVRHDESGLVRRRAGDIPLPPFARVGERMLRGGLGDRHSLQADREPRLVLVAVCGVERPWWGVAKW